MIELKAIFKPRNLLIILIGLRILKVLPILNTATSLAAFKYSTLD